jgi:hypothetical protein
MILFVYDMKQVTLISITTSFLTFGGAFVLIVNIMCFLYIKLPDHGVCRSMLPSLTSRMLISLFCRMWTTRYMHTHIYIYIFKPISCAIYGGEEMCSVFLGES